jgi:predicted acyl esterase
VRKRHDLAALIEVEHLWIPLRDGTRLAARLWRPADGEAVPGVMEYVPYRKGEATAIDDSIRQRYLAAHGFACLRVDVRGAGESDGVLADEFTAQELAGGCDVIAWLAQQPWCSGRVGLMGISWGGFNALQIAALRPPALGAVISACSTDDRYADDVHYRGGCLLASDMLGWASTLQALSARPPDPAVVGASWRQRWLERLEHTPHYVETWLQHPRRDDYWKHGSVCEDYGAIECPVFVVGGLADGYTNAVPRLLEGLRVPRRGLLGPWAHAWPHAARPGPSIGFLQECVRWFGHWLRDTDGDPGSGFRIWLQRSVEPAPSYRERPGRWIERPEPHVRTLHLSSDGLSESPGRSGTLEVSTDLDHGRHAGVFCPFGAGDLPGDQREEDARALVFDAEPVTKPTAFVGGCPSCTQP